MPADTRLDSVAPGRPASLQAEEEQRRFGAGCRRFLAEHWPMCIVLVAATAVRAVTLLA